MVATLYWRSPTHHRARPLPGMAQPVMAGTGKFLKMMGVTVYYTKISGGYLTYTKHCLDRRVGRVEVALLVPTGGHAGAEEGGVLAGAVEGELVLVQALADAGVDPGLVCGDA